MDRVGTVREEGRMSARFRLGRLGGWWKFTKMGKCKGETDLGGGLSRKTARATLQT